MAPFLGFSTDHLVPLPAEFFTEIVPAIKDPVELKLTLHIFYLFSRRRGRNRRIGWDELLEDEVLRRSLRALSPMRPFGDLLEEGLECAVNRGVLLHVASVESGRARSWYLANTPVNRDWAEAHGSGRVGPSPGEPEEPLSIFGLYEQNIGLLTPLLAEELREAAEHYPQAWIEEAVREATRSNVRSWRYIRRILERWEADGKASPQDRVERSVDLSKYTTGKYAHLFRRGGDEEPGVPDL
jgi:DNA replication protein